MKGKKCTVCSGSGWVPEGNCPACGGLGKIRELPKSKLRLFLIIILILGLGVAISGYFVTPESVLGNSPVIISVVGYPSECTVAFTDDGRLLPPAMAYDRCHCDLWWFNRCEIKRW